MTTLPGQDYGYTPYKHSQSKDGVTGAVDARNATFRVSNSQNANPTSSQECDVGSLKVNRYPIGVYNSDYTNFVGGLVNSDIPLASDWNYTYCNSAAIIHRYANGGSVDGVRFWTTWDTLRPSDVQGSAPYHFKNNWATNVRDDFVENDGYRAITVDDNLVDGAFHFVSMAGSSNSTSASRSVPVTGNVVRLRPWLYKGNQQFGAILKGNSYSPTLVFNNNVIAVDAPTGSTWSSYWSRTWSKIGSCSNNLFLWMSDRAIPSSVGTPKSCFTVLKGAAARAKWAEVKQNWINCHPKLRRRSDDPLPDPATCRRGTFGGY